MESNAEAFVVSFGGSVSSLVHEHAGAGVHQELLKQRMIIISTSSLEVGDHFGGDVVVTHAGSLEQRYIFHTFVREHQSGKTESENATYLDGIIDRIISRSLEIGRSLRIQTIAFHALGTGYAGHKLEDVAVLMLRGFTNHLTNEIRPFTLELYFYELKDTQIKEIYSFHDQIILQAVRNKINLRQNFSDQTGMYERIKDLLFLLQENVTVNISDLSEIVNMERETLRGYMVKLIDEFPTIGRIDVQNQSFRKLSQSENLDNYLTLLTEKGLI